MKKTCALFLFSVFSSIGMSADVPSASIPLDKFLDTPSVNACRKNSAVLRKILVPIVAFEPNEGAQITISCQEFLSDDGSKYRMPPSMGIIGIDGMESDDGRFVRVYEAYTGTATREVEGKNVSVETFLISVDYNWDDRKGILLVPFWAVLDRSNAKDPKVKHWGVDDERVSNVEG